MPNLTQPSIMQRRDLHALEGQRISIVIPCYELSDKLKRTLWSIRQNADVPFELYVALGQQCVAKNRNKGLDVVTGDIIVFMDDDVILPPNFLSNMAAVLAKNKDIGVVSAMMTAPNGQPQNDLWDLAPDELRDCVPPGTCFMYVKDRLNGEAFDENYLASQWEDTDFMLQVREQGLRTVATGDVWILHDNNWTENTGDTWKQNRAYFKQKWPDLSRKMEHFDGLWGRS